MFYSDDGDDKIKVLAENDVDDDDENDKVEDDDE